MISDRLISTLLRWAILTVALVLTLPAQAETRFSSVLAGAGRPNAVVITYPSDPCGALYGALASQLAETELRFDKVTLDTEPFFLHFCNQKKDEWVAQITATVTGPITDLQTQLSTAVDQEVAALTAGFWKFVAEQLYTVLPPEAQARYAPGSPELEAMAVEWLHNAPAEAQAYALAYFTTGEDRAWLLAAWTTYVDLTNGESAEILAGFNGVLATARTRLGQIVAAGHELENAPPDTPSSDALAKVGLSGEWLDRFKAHEGKLRALNETYQIGEAISVMSSAMGSDDQADRVQGFFGLMRIAGEVASSSQVPLLSVVGDIVKAYADAADQLLAATLALEEQINKRNGFCLGVGVPSRDPKAEYFNDKGVLVCPLRYGTWPFKHVYVTQGAQSPSYYFYNGESFTEGTNMTGREGVLAALALIDAGEELGYPITRDPDSHANLVGAVYNTSPPGGPLALMEQAEEMVDDIEGGMGALRDLVAPGDRCSLDQITAAVAEAMGETPESLARPLSVGGERLANAIAASFVAFEGGFGPGVTRGGRAVETYSELAENLASLSVVILEGEVRDDNGERVPEALLDVSVAGGEEVRGCEAWVADATGRFSITALSLGGFPVVTASAEAGAGRGETESFGRDYVRRTALSFADRDGAVTALTEIILRVPAPEQDPSDATPDEPTPDAPGPDTDTAPPEDEPVPESPDPELEAACVALEQGLADLEAQLASGALEAVDRLAAQIEPYGGATERGALCDPSLAERLAELRDRLARAQRAVEAVQVALAACDPAALDAAGAALAAVPEVSFAGLEGEIGRARGLVAGFETARSAYLANRLSEADAGLREVLAGFNAPPPPICGPYIARAESGLEKIATLIAFRTRVDAAIAACDLPLITRLTEVSTGRDHVMFTESIARLEAAEAQCREQIAAQSCAPLLAEFDTARTAYRANRLGDAEATLLRIKSALDNGAGPCEGLPGRVAQGLANIATLHGLERDLSSAVSSCETAVFDRIEARAQSATHPWFAAALGRISTAREACAEAEAAAQADETCDALTQLGGQIAVAADAADWATAQSLIDEATRLAESAGARRECPEQQGQVQRAAAAVAALQSALAEVDRAVTDCETDFAALAARLDAIGATLPSLDRAKARVAEAQRACAARDTAPDPEPQAATGDTTAFDGTWQGSGSFRISHDGETMVVPIDIQVSIANGAAHGTLSTNGGGVPLSGGVDDGVLVLSGQKTENGVTGSVTYRARIDASGVMVAEGSVNTVDMACVMEGIGEAIGGAIAGAATLGLGGEDEEPEERTCPNLDYPSDWTARR